MLLAIGKDSDFFGKSSEQFRLNCDSEETRKFCDSKEVPQDTTDKVINLLGFKDTKVKSNNGLGDTKDTDNTVKFVDTSNPGHNKTDVPNVPGNGNKAEADAKAIADSIAALDKAAADKEVADKAAAKAASDKAAADKEASDKAAAKAIADKAAADKEAADKAAAKAIADSLRVAPCARHRRARRQADRPDGREQRRAHTGRPLQAGRRGIERARADGREIRDKPV